MDDQPQFRYYKRCETADSTPLVVWRSNRQFFGFERWNGEVWVDDPDLFYKLQDEYDYWDATEDEALAALPVLSAQYRERAAQREQHLRSEAEHLQIERKNDLDGLAVVRREGLGLDGTDKRPLSTLNEGAIALHELFLSLTAAGFTDDQALDMVVKVMLNLTGADHRSA